MKPEDMETIVCKTLCKTDATVRMLDKISAGVRTILIEKQEQRRRSRDEWGSFEEHKNTFQDHRVPRGVREVKLGYTIRKALYNTEGLELDL